MDDGKGESWQRPANNHHGFTSMLSITASQFATAHQSGLHLDTLELLDDPFRLSELQARVLANDIAQSKQLKSIKLYGCMSNSQNGAEGVVRTIICKQGIGLCPTIHDIEITNVSNPAVFDVFHDMLLKMQALGKLRINFHSRHDTPRFGQQMSDVLKIKQSLTSLTLEHVLIGDEGCAAMAQGLHDNITLEALELCNCRIGDVGITALVDNWHPDSKLAKLSIRHNRIGPQGAQRLVQAIGCHPTMTELDVSWNTNMGFAGLYIMGNALVRELSHLTRLAVMCCADYVHKYKYEWAEGQERAWLPVKQAFLNAMKQNIVIQQLDVNKHDNDSGVVYLHYLPFDFEQEINFYVGLNRMGRFLLAIDGHHELASSVWCYILAKCQRQDKKLSPSLTYFFLREKPEVMMLQKIRNEKQAMEE